MLNWGFFCAQWIGYGCSFVEGDFQCKIPDDDTIKGTRPTLSGRFPLTFQCVPGIILAVGVPFLPDSPRWLCEKDRNEEAKAVL